MTENTPKHFLSCQKTCFTITYNFPTFWSLISNRIFGVTGSNLDLDASLDSYIFMLHVVWFRTLWGCTERCDRWVVKGWTNWWHGELGLQTAVHCNPLWLLRMCCWSLKPLLTACLQFYTVAACTVLPTSWMFIPIITLRLLCHSYSSDLWRISQSIVMLLTYWGKFDSMLILTSFVWTHWNV